MRILVRAREGIVAQLTVKERILFNFASARFP
jgi:hypothetical protein